MNKRTTDLIVIHFLHNIKDCSVAATDTIIFFSFLHFQLISICSFPSVYIY